MNGWLGEWVGGWMDGWLDGWMDNVLNLNGWMDGRTEGRKEERKDGWMDGWMDGRMGGWVDEWMHGWGGCTAKHTNVQTKVTDSPEASISKAKSIGLGQPSKHNGKKEQVRLVFRIIFVSRRKNESMNQ